MFEYPYNIQLMLESMLKMCPTSTLEYMHQAFTEAHTKACLEYAKESVLTPLASPKHVISDAGLMELKKEIEYTDAALSALNDALSFAKANANWALADGDELPYVPKKTGEMTL